MATTGAYLGHMVWWSVGNPHVQAADIEEAVAALGIPLPAASAPVDVFRRLSSMAMTYDLDQERSVILDLHKVSSQSTMLARHIVRTVRKHGVPQKAYRVGEAVFYRPPKGQPERARMRVTVYPELLSDRRQIEKYAEDLRVEYKRQLGAVDAQRVRRMVRNFLASVGAVYLNGPYFVPNLDDVERLQRLLLDVIGGGSNVMTIPVVDDEPRRRLIEAALATPQEEEEEE